MEQLIISYYNAILRVDPTPAQIQLWLNLIDPNNPDPGIEDLADALCFQSPETISLMKIYQVVLGRVPDSGRVSTSGFRSSAISAKPIPS